MEGPGFLTRMPDDVPSPPSAAPPTWRQRFGAWLYRQRIAAAWVIVLVAITAIAVATVHADALRQGRSMTLVWAILLEGSSHLMIGLMVPALYWFHRRFPPVPLGRNLLAHAAITVPFSLVHVLGMFVLRWAIAPLLGRTYSIQLDLDTLFYEYRKDAITYLILSTVLVALRYVFAEKPEAAAATEATTPASPIADTPADDPPSASPAGRLERFAVRRKDKEILVSAQDIAWIEAAGNYAILHVGGETYDIRSSLSRLEAELDPSRFVRVHKSYIVNVERVREVEPWISGDSRLKLDDGAVVSLSRRYRPRFEKVVPVRT